MEDRYYADYSDAELYELYCEACLHSPLSLPEIQEELEYRRELRDQS